MQALSQQQIWSVCIAEHNLFCLYLCKLFFGEMNFYRYGLMCEIVNEGFNSVYI